jgi:nucleotide-binding universal stress UspA family protein
VPVPESARWQCPPRTILVGVDFGDASARALAFAREIGSAFEARLRTLHAERFEPPPYFTIEQIARLEAERVATQAASAQHLVRFAADSAYPVEAVVADEPPVEAILDEAKSADLIVVGTHGRRGPGRWWLGSVAERVVRAAAVPVLVTHASDAPPNEVFARVTLVRDGDREDEVVRACAAGLAALGGGALVEGGSISQCGSDLLQRASLVVLPMPGERPTWTLTDPVARVLGSCERPVLFIPSV